MDLKYENIPSFALHTFLLTFLSEDSNTFSMFCPPQYFNFSHGFEIWKYSKFCLWSLKTLYTSWYFNFFRGFEIWKHSKFCPRHFSFGIPSSGDLCFFMDLNYEHFPILPSTLFIWYTLIRILQHFSIIWNLRILLVLSSTLFYWYTYHRIIIHICCVRHNTSIFYGFEIWNHSKFCLPHFSINIPISGQ